MVKFVTFFISTLPLILPEIITVDPVPIILPSTSPAIVNVLAAANRSPLITVPPEIVTLLPATKASPPTFPLTVTSLPATRKFCPTFPLTETTDPTARTELETFPFTAIVLPAATKSPVTLPSTVTICPAEYKFLACSVAARLTGPLFDDLNSAANTAAGASKSTRASVNSNFFILSPF